MSYNHIKNIKVFPDPISMAHHAAEELLHAIENTDQENFHVAFSGGSTPNVFFEILSGKNYAEKINWKKLKIFWCDERMVSPSDNESNYGNAKKILFDIVNIPDENIFRIAGENDLKVEIKNYGEKVLKIVPKDNMGFPVFDLIFLGLGEDGHTASLFPNQKLRFVYKNICGIAQHPVSGQKRISITLKIINNARQAAILVTGRKKTEIIYKIFIEEENDFPVSQVNPRRELKWLIDEEAYSLVEKNKKL